MNAIHNRRMSDRAPFTGPISWAIWRAYYGVRRDLSRLFS